MSALDRLTPRQQEVLQLATSGLTRAQTAERFGIAVSTVMTHRHQILRRLGVPTICAAVALVREPRSDLSRSTKALEGLGPAQLQVLRCVAEGLTNQEIADRIGRSIHTVKNQLYLIYRMLGVTNRMSAVGAACDLFGEN